MVRSTCLAVDAGLPDVLQTPPGWRKGPVAGRRSARPAAPASLALRGGLATDAPRKCAARQVAEPAQRVRPPVPAYSSGHFKRGRAILP